MTSTTPPIRRTAKRPLIMWDAILTSVLLGLLGVLSFVVSAYGAFLAMASDPCGGVECNYDLISLGVLAAMTLPWILLVAAVIVAILLLVWRRIAFWVPIAAAPLVVASWFVGAAIATAGVPTG